jgi:two-component system, NtrC family, sensor kinase
MNRGSARSKRNELDIPRLCRSLAEASPMPTASIDATTRVVSYANPAFCSLVKQCSDELVGKPFSAIAPEGEECLLLLDRVFQTGQPEIHIGSGRSAPHPFYWSYAIWPILADDDRVTGALIQVTETTAFHKQVTDMNEALLISSIRQHELVEATHALNVLLQAENKARVRRGRTVARKPGSAPVRSCCEPRSAGASTHAHRFFGSSPERLSRPSQR